MAFGSSGPDAVVEAAIWAYDAGFVDAAVVDAPTPRVRLGAPQHIERLLALWPFVPAETSIEIETEDAVVVAGRADAVVVAVRLSGRAGAADVASVLLERVGGPWPNAPRHGTEVGR